MLTPPPLPRRSTAKWPLVIGIFVVAGLLVVGGGIYMVTRTFLSTDFVHNADNTFGDQDLKTTVALVELHKLRYGRYPAALKDLQFTGQWDQLALHSVFYVSNPDRSAYYVEVSRGWVGKPTFTMPPEFWRGTGYSEALRPSQPAQADK